MATRLLSKTGALKAYGILDIFYRGENGLRQSLELEKFEVSVDIQPIHVLGSYEAVAMEYMGDHRRAKLSANLSAFKEVSPSNLEVQFQCPRCALIHERQPHIDGYGVSGGAEMRFVFEANLSGMEPMCDPCVEEIETLRAAIRKADRERQELERKARVLSDQAHDLQMKIDRVDEHPAGKECEVCDRRRQEAEEARMEALERAELDDYLDDDDESSWD